jgi:hypothetical protein
MATLDQVQDYIADARTILLDTLAPFRYDDVSLLVAFNVALLEARRVRADLFVYADTTGAGAVPYYAANDATPVPLEQSFRLAIVFGTVAHALTRDQEDVQDARATTFMTLFNSILTGVRMPGIQAGRGAAPAAAAATPVGPPQ